MKKYFVSAIGTDSGKTIVSALLTEAFHLDYWKPVQAGLETDTNFISSKIDQSKIHPEAYLLKSPMSPHAAAKIDGVEVNLDSVILPETNANLLIEGAGGLLVPLNDKDTIADLISSLNAELIFVINFYLGSINHTLLSLNEIKRRNYRVKGVVFNGEVNEDSRAFIEEHCPYPVIATIPQFNIENESLWQEQVDKLRESSLSL